MAFDVEFKSSSTSFDVEYEKSEAIGINFEDATRVVINAYDIAVANGFVGTVEDWLKSLVGPRGEKGEKGDAGEKGPKGDRGIQGEQGPKGEDGANGRDGIDGKDGAPGADGRNGVDGRDGQNGRDGKDGYTPQKGVDYFDGKDGANGRDGVDGAKGADGAKGDKGDPFRFEDFTPEQLALLKGDKGEKGDDGVTPDTSVFALKTEMPDVSTLVDASVFWYEMNATQATLNGKVDITTFYSALSSAQETLDGKVDVSQYNQDLAQANQVLQTMGAQVASNATAIEGKADSTHTHTKSQITDFPPIPSKTSDLENDSGFLTAHQSLSAYAKTADVNTALSGKANTVHDHTETDIKPIQSKTYQNIIATANNQAGGTFYCFKLRPNNFYQPCSIKFKVTTSINESMNNANKDYYRQETVSEMLLSGASLIGYRNTNSYYSSNYRPHYYTSVYRTTKAGFDAGKEHYIGVSLYNSTSPTTATLKRDIKVELLEFENCTVEMLDSMVVQSAFYNATDYSGVSNCDAVNPGTKQTGDNNSIDRLTYASFQPLALDAVYGSQLVLSKDGVSYSSICKSRSTGTGKACTTRGFRPEHILYYSGSGTVNNGSRLTTSVVHDALPFDFRYSFNPTTALVAHKAVYLKCTYNDEDGLYYLEPSGWATQTLPTTEDGYYYILVGYSYSTTSIYIKPTHPVFKFVNGAMREESYFRAYEMIGGIANGSY